MAVLGRLADNMLTTYLGGGAGKRVLSGQIKRGDGETIRAALVMADMRKSTVLAERDGRQVYIDTLNQFFDAIATPFNRSGGEILSFLGDGFLAVYPCGRHKEPSQVACRAALAAVVKATQRMNELNRRTKARRPVRDRLRHRAPCRQRHVRQCRTEGPADLLGVRRRRQRGPAPAGTHQEVSAQRDRQRRLRRLLRRRLDDARRREAARRRRGDHRACPRSLEDVARPRRRAHSSRRYDGYSDAENVILLHRDQRKPGTRGRRSRKRCNRAPAHLEARVPSEARRVSVHAAHCRHYPTSDA